MEMEAIVLFCFVLFVCLFVFVSLRINIPNSSPVNKFFEISTIKLSLITCQITFIMKCLNEG